MKIALLDDEVVIVKGIKNMISRLRGDKDEIYAFTDCEELLRFVNLQSCDLLITDICMENCDGFQVIERMKEGGYCKKFAIISGFDYFSYAKKSIEVGVVDYILKPIEEEELLRLIENVEQELQTERIKETVALLKDYIDGHISYQRLMDAGSSIVCSYAEKRSCILKYFDKKDLGVFKALKERFEDILTLEAIHSVYYIVIDTKINDSELKNIVGKTLKKFCVVSDVVEFKDLGEAYIQCKRGAAFRPFFQDKDVLFWSEINKKQVDSFRLIKKENEFYVALQSKGEKHAKNMLVKLLNEPLQQESLSFLEGFISRINDIARDGVGKIYLHEYANRDELTAGIMRVVNTGKQAEKVTENILLSAALTYIERNYCKAITLTTVANEISVNYYYLSRLFKEQMKMNFKQYLTVKRLTYATKLLKDPSLKIYEVAQMCGYENVNTFNEVFKNMYTMTPKEYRMQHLE